MGEIIQQKHILAPDGVRLSYRVLGRGPAVMLLHGFCQWSEMWMTNGVADRLGTRFTLILQDRRGHGDSDRPSRPESFGMHMVGDVFRILDAEGHDRANLVGFSQGSEIAWRAAIDHPDCVRSLFLISSGWPGPDLDLALQGYEDILGWLPQAIAERQAWLTPDPDIDALQAIVASMREVIDVPPDALTRLSLPVFGLVGAEDPERPTLERLSGLVPNYTFKVLPDTDHPGSSEHPCLPALIDRFLGG